MGLSTSAVNTILSDLRREIITAREYRSCWLGG